MSERHLLIKEIHTTQDSVEKDEALLERKKKHLFKLRQKLINLDLEKEERKKYEQSSNQ